MVSHVLCKYTLYTSQLLYTHFNIIVYSIIICHLIPSSVIASYVMVLRYNPSIMQ